MSRRLLQFMPTAEYGFAQSPDNFHHIRTSIGVMSGYLLYSYPEVLQLFFPVLFGK